MAFLLNDVDNSIIQPLIKDFTTYIVTPLANFISSSIISPFTSVVGSLQNFVSIVTGGLAHIYNDIVSVIRFTANFFSNIIGYFNSYVVSPLTGAFNSGLSFLQGIPNTLVQIWSFISGLAGQIEGDFNSLIVQPLTGIFNSAIGFLSDIPSILGQVWNTISGLGNTILSGVSDFFGSIASGLTSLGNTILSGLNIYVVQPVQGFFNAIASGLGDLGHTLSNVGETVVSGFNQLATGLNNVLSDFQGAFSALGNIIWSGLSSFFTKDVLPTLQTAWQDIQKAFSWVADQVNGILTELQKLLNDAITAIMPKSPDEALDTALLAVGIGAGLTLVGELASIAIDATQPVKGWGVQKMLEQGLELTGIASVGAVLYEMIVSSGWGEQLKHYFNYHLQPRFIDSPSSARAVWYGQRDIEQYREDLRYEGFNDDAIAAKVSTLFRPMPIFVLSTMIQQGLLSDDFIKTQLQMNGYPPDQLGDLVSALQNRQVVPYQDTARGLVFNYFKDGFISQGLAKEILGAFNIPSNQVDWILTIANYEYKYEQFLKLQTYIIDLFAKEQLSASEAVDALVSLGMDKDRATVLIATKGITQAPTLPKADRAAILQDALSLNVNVG